MSVLYQQLVSMNLMQLRSGLRRLSKPAPGIGRIELTLPMFTMLHWGQNRFRGA